MRNRSLQAIAALVLAVLARGAARGDSTVVFNEVHYNPPGDAAAAEWIELHNQMAVDMDLSGWSLADGVAFDFPPGTVIPGGGFLVVAADPEALRAAGVAATVLGPFVGRLADDGERLELRNNSQRTMNVLRYDHDEPWPVAPDGSGATLAKRDPQAGSDDAANWTASPEIGGTPGGHNFPLDLPGNRFPEALSGYWRFEGTDSVVLDPAGDNDGRLGRETLRVAGLVGAGAVSFNNTGNAYVNVGAGAARDFNASTGSTIEVLVRLEWSGELDDADQIFRKEDGSRRIVFGFQHDAVEDDRDVPIDPPAQPVLAFGLSSGGTYSELDMPLDGAEGRPSLADLKDGDWHHLAATYDSATGVKSIWVDGAAAFSVTLAPGSTVESGGSSSAYIGNMTGRREPFTGTL